MVPTPVSQHAVGCRQFLYSNKRKETESPKDKETGFSTNTWRLSPLTEGRSRAHALQSPRRPSPCAHHRSTSRLRQADLLTGTKPRHVTQDDKERPWAQRRGLASRFQCPGRPLTLQERQAGVELCGAVAKGQGAALHSRAPARHHGHTVLFKQNHNHLSKTVSSHSQPTACSLFKEKRHRSLPIRFIRLIVTA